jgi:hypothetical protein
VERYFARKWGLTRGGFDTAKTRMQFYLASLAYSTTEFPLSYSMDNKVDFNGG